MPDPDREISYPPVLTTLGADYEQQWGESAHTEVKRVSTSVASRSTFGDIPAARDFAAVYQAAQHVYEATLRGIKQDLEHAGQALREAGREMEARDEASSDAFAAIRAPWVQRPEDLDSTRAHDEATRDDSVREGVDAQSRLGDGVPGDGGDAPAGQGAPAAAGDDTTMDVPGGPPSDG
ncbi:hypothetical protein JQN72_08235 [Phycicoccus sp. CSK15P-2]|uniref:hypothetical protein n=1 Tax=Phycicoccus sp. CSK15P-2 TaxID=2807627 RepID=UPI001952035D|nr:hypothetical protein [Phycicoccus sp. CSK15P-2]MBM6404230.1 hypothetical protein [Phycicoccus sp. CSK15P-2]